MLTPIKFVIKVYSQIFYVFALIDTTTIYLNRNIFISRLLVRREICEGEVGRWIAEGVRELDGSENGED